MTNKCRTQSLLPAFGPTMTRNSIVESVSTLLGGVTTRPVFPFHTAESNSVLGVTTILSRLDA